MLSGLQILEFAQEAARNAEARNLQPASIRAFDPGQPQEFVRTIPFLGSYIPAGWQPAGFDDLFVDSTGIAGDHEAALSLRQFAARLYDLKRTGENYGLGIIEAGEFQVYVRVYRPHVNDFTHTGALTPAELKVIG